MSADRRYLNIPFSDKDKVKALGGMWDSLINLWWVPMHVPLASIRQWLFK